MWGLGTQTGDPWDNFSFPWSLFQSHTQTHAQTNKQTNKKKDTNQRLSQYGINQKKIYKGNEI